MVVQHTDPPKPFKLTDWLPGLPGLLVTLFGIYVVHKLTKSREREKLVYELYKTAGENADALAKAASAAWCAARGPTRLKLVAETKWRQAQLAATVERLRVLSVRKRTRWQWTPWFRRREDTTITMRDEIVRLRRAITEDPFEDPIRRANKGKATMVEQSIGAFRTELDARLHRWME